MLLIGSWRVLTCLRLSLSIRPPGESWVSSSNKAVTDLHVSEAPAPEVTRRDELNAAVEEASRVYRESHSFAAPLWAQSGLRSTYRASDHPVDLPFGFA
jgi:hypothetical protein